MFWDSLCLAENNNHEDFLQQCHSMLHLSRETEYTNSYGKDTHVHAWLSHLICSATPYVTMIWSAKHSHYDSPDDINCIMAMNFEKYMSLYVQGLPNVNFHPLMQGKTATDIPGLV